VPPDRWNDQAIDQLAEMLREDIRDLKDWVGDVERRLTQAMRDSEERTSRQLDALVAQVAGRRKNRLTMSIALIGACATVLAAIIGLVAVVLQSQ
jgi:hypothetical protein